jgi:SpoVK/Ycf46/Vps4 family AAA+-type ATPase
MIRRLVRECHKRFKVRVSCLAIKGSTDADDLARFFSSGMYGSDEKRILVLEDLDSLTRETRIPRAFLLNQLDGLHQKKGILVLGTTNHPEALDPALVHRPSRFDRVWHFPLPSLAIRLQWFRETYGHVDAEQLERLARQTGGWSFAYLKELRITAGIEALHAGADAVNGENLMSAHQLLAAQFKAGKKGGAVGDDEASDIAGFRGGSKEMSLSALLAAAPQATERAQHPGQDEGSARFSAHAA